MTKRFFLRVLLSMVLLGTSMTSMAADALDVWHWRSPRWTAAPMIAVSFHEGRFVAVGEQGRIVVSEDGVHWQAAESSTTGNLRAVAWGDGQWIAVGDYGEVVISQDGLRWTRESAGVSLHLRGVTRGNGLWVAVGDESVILTSPDGRAWKSRASGGDPLRAVVWAGGVFVAGGGAKESRDQNGKIFLTSPARVLISSNGLQWKKVPQQAGGPVTSIAYGADRFVAITASGNALISVDGSVWTAASPDWGLPRQPQFLSIAYDGTRYVVTQSARFGDPNRLWSSPDGINWSAAFISGLENAYNFSGLASGPPGWVAVGAVEGVTGLPEGTIVHSKDGRDWSSTDDDLADHRPFIGFGFHGYRDKLAFAGGYFFRSDESFNEYAQTEQTIFRVSTTGGQWERRRVSFDTHYSLPAFGHGRFVCVGRDGRMLVSQDASHWQQMASGVTNALTCVVFSETEGRFVVGGERGIVLVSSDGMDWKGFQVPTTNSVVMVASSKGRIVVGCLAYETWEGSTPRARSLYTLSENGTWSGPIQVGLQFIDSLESWEEGFFAGDGWSLYESTDGAEWRYVSGINGVGLPIWGGGRLLIFQSGSTRFFERRAGEEAWRRHDLPWRVVWNGFSYVAPIAAAYGHGTFLLAHENGSLIQSEPLEPMAPQPNPAPSPAISEGPGSPVIFEAIAIGSEPKGYQWRRNGVDIPGAQTALFTSLDSGVSDGSYTCWVTNALGGATVGPFQVVTAGVARLDVPAHALGVRVQGTPGVRYRLEKSYGLETSVGLQPWFKLRDLELTSEGEGSVSSGLEGMLPPSYRLFYRARRLP